MKKILIIEDNQKQLNNAVLALRDRADLSLATSLNQARKILEEGSVDGVITDLCFHEFGAVIMHITAQGERNACFVKERGAKKYLLETIGLNLTHEVRQQFELVLKESEESLVWDYEDVASIALWGTTSEVLIEEIVRVSLELIEKFPLPPVRRGSYTDDIVPLNCGSKEEKVGVVIFRL